MWLYCTQDMCVPKETGDFFALKSNRILQSVGAHARCEEQQNIREVA